MPANHLATTIERDVERWAPVVVFAGLPTIGLVSGPAWSSMIIGLAVLQLLSGLAAGRGLPRIDRPLAAIAVLFVALCWASAAWSIVPPQSLRGALGLTGVLAAMLVVCAGRYDRPGLADTVFRVLLIAILVGIAAACLDMALGYPLESLISTKPGTHAATKYNRGLDYLVLIVWPVLAHACWRRRWWAVCVLGLALAVMLVLTLSLAARAAVAAGLVALLLAWAVPRMLCTALPWLVAMFVAALPAALHLLAARMTELAPVLKPSGLMRLEIWDYMTARIFQYPILGWGLLSAKVLPIHPEEMARYIYGDPRGFYPHNQWLELWVELGLLGAALGLAFALLVLRRIRPLPPPIRPFAYAAFAAAMTIASVNYEVVTDSWWAALAACAVLFLLLRHCLPEGAAGGALARTPPPLEGGGRGEGCSPAEDCARGHTSPQPPPSRGGGVLGRSRLPA